MGELGAMIRRRELLQSIGVGWFADQALPDHAGIEGRIVGASHRVGHLLRDGGVGADGPTETVDVVVVGSGASGMSAARRLEAAGVDCTVLELEPFVGGTATWGEEGVVPHPWGAHYLPVPEAGATAVQRLLTQLGVLTGWDAAGRPQFRDELLCHAPEERIFVAGEWYPGLIPDPLLTAAERAEVERFLSVTRRWSTRVGNDGKPAFALPSEESSQDPDILALDTRSMAAWLREEGFATDVLWWLVNYATLDDFGADVEQCSAWAGLHYFSARRFESDQTEGSRFLVWPEGNGWLIRRMRADLQRPVRTGHLVTAVKPGKHRVELSAVDVATGRALRLDARGVVLAVPAFVADRLLPGAPVVQRTTAPWLVANLHVRRPPEPNHAWDSVVHGAAGLGYVDAGHQRLELDDQTVWTYFRAFGGADVARVRRHLVGQSWARLARTVLDDLTPAHPDLERQTERLDVMIWGHAMPRPTVGFLGERPFSPPARLGPRVAWAHVDQTGFALFEEANLQGTRAAELLCDDLGVARGDSWLRD